MLLVGAVVAVVADFLALGQMELQPQVPLAGMLALEVMVVVEQEVQAREMAAQVELVPQEEMVAFLSITKIEEEYHVNFRTYI
jgi:hypothetical protein